jgi:hypothetical protein
MSAAIQPLEFNDKALFVVTSYIIATMNAEIATSISKSTTDSTSRGCYRGAHKPNFNNYYTKPNAQGGYRDTCENLREADYNKRF